MTNRVRPGRPAPLQEVAAGKLRNLSAWLRDYITAIKNGQFHPFTSTERKVREATRNEPWGPTGARLQELADLSHNATDCEITFAVIQLRLGYPPEKWRNVYKALVLLDFLVLRGSEQCIQIAEEELMFKLEDLETFAYLTPEGKDHGINVRHRAKAIKELMLDGARLRAERQSNASKRKSYQGFTPDQLASCKPFHDDQDIPTPTSAPGGLRRTLSDSSMQGSKHQGYASEASHAAFSTPPREGMRNAGETKGVTMEMNKKQLSDLKQLLDLPQNRSCADCAQGGGAARASWASINTGVFLCMRCAGVHRGLGTHISKVRSCTLDTWLPEQVDFMARTGNAAANAFYEARLDPELKPVYGSADLQPFIFRKYTLKAYAEGSWPPMAEEQEELCNPSGQAVALGTSTTGLPSSAQRAQPLLQGSKMQRQTGRQQSDRRPRSSSVLPQLVTVPLPGEQIHSTTIEPVRNLMDFGPGDDQGTVNASGVAQSDAFRELEMLRPISSLHEEQHIVAAPQGILADAAAPAWTAHVPTEQPTFGHFSHATGLALATGSPKPPSVQSHQVVDGFSHKESVRDWGQLQQSDERLSCRTRTHAHGPSLGGESDLASTASSSFLTPRFTALHGPGPKGGQPMRYATAPSQYVPLDIARNAQRSQCFMPSSNGGQSALMQATKQWSANAKQGEKGVLDDLVLRAMADLPPSRLGGSMHEILAASQAPSPPSMMQLRATPQQQLMT